MLLKQAWPGGYLQVPGPGTSKGSPFKFYSDVPSCFIVTEQCSFLNSPGFWWLTGVCRVLKTIWKTHFFSSPYWPVDSGNKVFKHLFMRLSSANLFNCSLTTGTLFCCFWLLKSLFFFKNNNFIFTDPLKHKARLKTQIPSNRKQPIILPCLLPKSIRVASGWIKSEVKTEYA